MRYGLIGSILLHILVFGVVIFNFTFSGKDEAPPPLPVSVEIMSPQDYSERQAGKTDGKADKPSTPAQVKAPDAQASAKKEVEQKPSPKPTEKEALPPPAPKAAEAPAPAPKPVEQAKAEPAVEKPKPVVKKEPAPRPAPKPKVAEAKPTPNRTFDPNRIESLLKKDAPQERPQTSQSTMEAPPSKVYSDRQTAVLNRDPNAGAPSGDYDPNRPWHPASSLQDQAMGLPASARRDECRHMRRSCPKPHRAELGLAHRREIRRSHDRASSDRAEPGRHALAAANRDGCIHVTDLPSHGRRGHPGRDPRRALSDPPAAI